MLRQWQTKKIPRDEAESEGSRVTHGGERILERIHSVCHPLSLPEFIVHGRSRSYYNTAHE